MNLFDTDTVSTNENTFVNLDKGRHAYRIASAAISEKGQGVSVGFTKLDTGKRHTHLFAVLAAGDRGRIAKGDMKALWDASKLSGTPGIDRLPNFVDKVVWIEAVHTDPDEKGQVFSNIRRIEPYDGPAPVSKFHQPEDPDDKIPMGDQSAAPVETPATPAPAASKPATKWAGRKK